MQLHLVMIDIQHIVKAAVKMMMDCQILPPKGHTDDLLIQ